MLTVAHKCQGQQ